jgi:hypothetical protein
VLLAGETFDRDDLLADGGRRIEHARVFSLSINEHRAGAAYLNATAILGAGQSDEIP